MELKEEIVNKAASLVHNDWCMQELRAFYDRAKKEYAIGKNFGEAFRKACFKGEQKRNELDLDVSFLLGHEGMANSCLDDFNNFIDLFRMGVIDVKRYVKRELTQDEIAKAGSNYSNGEENILVSFEKLSYASKKENLEAAIGAYNVYVQMSKAGITIQEMIGDPKIKNLIGIAIHNDWLKRNMDHPNDSLKVPYDELDEWTQGQDITVFNALLEVVKSDPEKYMVDKVEGYELPDYSAEENSLLGIKTNSI